MRALPLPGQGAPNVALSSISCVDPRFCVAVGTFRPAAVSMDGQGEEPVVLRFDGQRWSTMTTPRVVNSELNGVDCVSRTTCIAVGGQLANAQGGSTLIEKMSGTTWSVVPSPSASWFPININRLQAVSCTSLRQCTAVGWDNGCCYPRQTSPNAGLIIRETAAGWAISPLAPLVPTPEYSPTASLYFVPTNSLDPTMLTSVACTRSLCVTVGNGDSLSGTPRGFLSRGEGWTVLSPHPLALNAVSCPLHAPCVGVGHDGTALSDQPCASASSLECGSVISSATSIAGLSGSGWHRVPSPNLRFAQNDLEAVSCGAGYFCVAVGEVVGPQVGQPQRNREGGALIEVESDGRWFVAPTPRTPGKVADSLASVSCPGPHVCIAVGQSVVNPLRLPTGPVHGYSVRIIR